LTHRQTQGQQAEIIVRLTGKFGNKAEQTVTAQEQCRRLTGRTRFFRENPNDDKQANAFKGKLVKLRRVARQHTVLLQPFGPQRIVRCSFRIFVTRLRETHCPESIEFGHASPKFAVDKVADTAGSQAQRYERCNGIHQF
jgi:hypothetical protein